MWHSAVSRISRAAVRNMLRAKRLHICVVPIPSARADQDHAEQTGGHIHHIASRRHFHRAIAAGQVIDQSERSYEDPLQITRD
jgi:hypothetical protein